jgi:hypothetical protein
MKNTCRKNVEELELKLNGAETYFLLLSLYSLLAFLPYTYCALIKAPPYPWMPWFAHHQAGLYWLAAAAGFGAMLGGPHSGQHKGSTRGLVLAGLAVVVGLYLTSRPFLPEIPNDWSAYYWSLASLLPLIILSVWRSDQNARADDIEKNGTLVGYSSGLLVAVAVSVVYLAASRIQIYRESHALELHAQFLNVAAWSVISHILVAVAFLSGFNLTRIISCQNKRPLL